MNISTELKPFFTEREWSEIEFALTYSFAFSHGTDGHHRLMLIAKLFDMLSKQSTMKQETFLGELGEPTQEV